VSWEDQLLKGSPSLVVDFEIRLRELGASGNAGPSQTTKPVLQHHKNLRIRIGTQIDHNAANYCSQDVPAYHKDDEACAGKFWTRGTA